MSTFESYLDEVLAIYKGSCKLWEQESRSNTSLMSVRYDGQHYIYIGASRKLSFEDMLQTDLYESLAGEIRLSLSRDELDGKTDDPVIKRLGQAAKRAIEAGVAYDRDSGFMKMDVCNNRIIVARR